MTLEVKEFSGWIEFAVIVVPRASRSEVVGAIGGALKVRVSAPPVDGAANKEVVKVLAKSLGVSRSTVSIISGSSSRTKRIRIDGVTVLELLAAFDT